MRMYEHDKKFGGLQLHKTDHPDHLKAFGYDEEGNIISYCGYEVGGWVECPVHGFYPTFYGVDLEEWRNRFEIRCQCPRCLADEILNAKLQTAAIPRRFLNRCLENFTVSEAWQEAVFAKVKSYVDNIDENLANGVCIVMCGRPGTGKTHLAIGIAQVVIAKQKTAIYTTVGDLIRRIRDTYGKGGTLERQQVYETCDLLIVDEIGVQANTQSELTQLFEIINTRYGEMRPTILLSNFGPEKIAQYVGDRVWDRLRENGGFCLPFIGQSCRLNMKEADKAAKVKKMQITHWKPELVPIDDEEEFF